MRDVCSITGASTTAELLLEIVEFVVSFICFLLKNCIRVEHSVAFRLFTGKVSVDMQLLTNVLEKRTFVRQFREI